jgi:hypothetical protein
VQEASRGAMHTTLHSLQGPQSLFPSQPPSHVAGQEDVLGTSSQLSVVKEVETPVLRAVVDPQYPYPELDAGNEPIGIGI